LNRNNIRLIRSKNLTQNEVPSLGLSKSGRLLVRVGVVFILVFIDVTKVTKSMLEKSKRGQLPFGVLGPLITLNQY
jgi:hypothetical protein